MINSHGIFFTDKFFMNNCYNGNTLHFFLLFKLCFCPRSSPNFAELDTGFSSTMHTSAMDASSKSAIFGRRTPWSSSCHSGLGQLGLHPSHTQDTILELPEPNWKQAPAGSGRLIIPYKSHSFENPKLTHPYRG